MAERWKFSAFVVYGFFIAAIVYPIYGNWVWGGGWLRALGRNLGLGHGAVDFAGSGVVHAVGGFAALAGAMVLGPRIGKFGKDGKPRAILGAQHPAGHPRRDHPGVRLDRLQRRVHPGGHRPALHASSSSTRSSPAAAGCLAAMFLVWKMWGKPDPSMTANGMLAGLVAITAPCAFVDPVGAVIIGIDRRLHRGRRASSSSSASSRSTTRSAPSRCTASTASGASSPSACSPTAATATAGTASTGTVTRPVLRRRLRPARRPGHHRRPSWSPGPSALMYAFFRVQKKLQGIRVTRDEEIDRPRHTRDGRRRPTRPPCTCATEPRST